MDPRKSADDDRKKPTKGRAFVEDKELPPGEEGDENDESDTISDDEIDRELRDNPLDAIIISQFAELSAKLNSQFVETKECLERLETRIEERSRELIDRIMLTMPAGSPEDFNRGMMQAMHLLQLDNRRVATELAELAKRVSGPAQPDIATLVASAVAEATRELNKQVVALHDQLAAAAEKKDLPNPPPVEPLTAPKMVREEMIREVEPPRRRHRMV